MFRITIFFLAALVAVGCTFDPGSAPGANNRVPNNRIPNTNNATNNLNNQNNANNGNNQNNANNINNQNNLNNQNNVVMDMASDMTDRDTGSDIGADSADTAPDLPVLCNGEMKDFQNDPDHCGRCDNACDDEFGSCINGACSCPGDTEPCGVANECTATLLDSNNCGQCGVTCGTAEWCEAGTCICRPGYTLCNGVCVDTRSNPDHCGSCNNTCADNRDCRNSNCERNCGVTSFSCDVSGQPDACVRDDQFSEWHCNPSFSNNCGDQCAGDESCFRQDAFSAPSCYAFRPAIQCDICPCNECEDDEFCFVSEQVNVGMIYCIDE